MKSNAMNERIKYWSQLLLLPIYGLSFLMPRNKKYGCLEVHLEEDLPRIQDIFIYMYDRTVRKFMLSGFLMIRRL